MSDNTALWDKLGKTDPKHTKKFKRAGGFEGTAIKPMFSYRRMTEEFGPCGKGWGINAPAFQTVSGVNHEVLVYCTVSIWYGDGKEVFGVGGDKVVTHIKANEKYNRPERWENDDEAFKKAYTDAVTNALKMIGVGADVHMGMFDDNKYVNTVANEFEAAANEATKSSAQLKRDGAWEEVSGSLDNDLLDCHSLVALAKLRDDYRSKVDGWPKAWMLALKDKFDGHEDLLIKQREAEEKDAA
jgi:hypothetical protein